jgi:hypothetical protein
MRRTTLVLAPVVLVLLLVSGCGGGGGRPSRPPAANDPPASGPVATGQATAGQPAKGEATCAVASASLVRSTLGLTVGEPEETRVVRDAVLCVYRGGAGGGGSVTMNIELDQTADVFAQRRATLRTSSQATQDLAGFQDEAFTATMVSLGVTYNTLAARKGSVTIQVTSRASVDRTKAFEEAVFAKLA